MDGDEVGDLQQLVDAHAGGLLLLEHVGGQVGVIGHDVHLEGTAQFAHALADAAEAQDAQGLAPQLAAHEFILVPGLVHLHVVVGGDGVAGQIQHLGEGQLGHGVGVQAGSVEDLHALCLAGVHVHVVQAHGAHADDLQVGGGVNDLLGDLGVHAHDEHIVVRDELDQLLLGGEHVGVHLHILAQLLGDGTVDGINDQTFHGKSSFLLHIGALWRLRSEDARFRPALVK